MLCYIQVKIVFGVHEKPLIERLRAQTTTRKIGRGAAKRPRVEPAFQPPKHIQDNVIQRFYYEKLLFWLHLTLESGLKTLIKADLDLQLQHL